MFLGTPFSIQAKDKSKSLPASPTINCYFRTEHDSSRRKIVKLNDVPQRIEFYDDIGDGFGSGSLIDGQLVEGGKVILLKIESDSQSKNHKSDSTEIHYIDSTLLPRNIPVKAGMLQGAIVVEKGKP